MTSSSQPRTRAMKDDAVNRALEAYRKAGGRDDAGARAALKAALDENTFRVGDEVMTDQGAMVGVIIEIHDDAAVISWSMRGTSSEPVDALEHVPREPEE